MSAVRGLNLFQGRFLGSVVFQVCYCGFVNDVAVPRGARVLMRGVPSQVQHSLLHRRLPCIYSCAFVMHSRPET